MNHIESNHSQHNFEANPPIPESWKDVEVHEFSIDKFRKDLLEKYDALSEELGIDLLNNEVGVILAKLNEFETEKRKELLEKIGNLQGNISYTLMCRHAKHDSQKIILPKSYHELLVSYWDKLSQITGDDFWSAYFDKTV